MRSLDFCQSQAERKAAEAGDDDVTEPFCYAFEIPGLAPPIESICEILQMEGDGTKTSLAS